MPSAPRPTPHNLTYTVGNPQDVRASAKPVTIAYTYRTLMAQNGHMLFFDVEQPTRDLRVSFDYTDCGIATVSTLDLVPSVRPTRIEQPHDNDSDRVIRLDFDGWTFPRSGVAFVWTLESEAVTGVTASTGARGKITTENRSKVGAGHAR